MRARTSRACRMVSQLPRRPVAEKGVRARGYASYRTAPLVKPPPKPTSTTLSPGWMLPLAYASHSDMGMHADDELPVCVMDTWKRSSGRPMRLAAYLMMRRFA